MKDVKTEAAERYPDMPVVLGRGNTCLSCGEVRRDAFEAGAKWQKSIVWHKPSEKLPEYEEKSFSFGSTEWLSMLTWAV